MQRSKLTKNKKKLLNDLSELVGKENVFSTQTYLILYGYDASLERGQPDFVVFPENTFQISQIVQLAEKYQIPYLPRGAGTNLSGGAVPRNGGLVIALTKLNRILEIDTENRRATVQPGVVNLHLQEALSRTGFFYAPDPASQKVSTIGGNVGENAGGPHCLKYGVTFNHILGLKVILPGGKLIILGGGACDEPGFDLVGLLVGSEGTLGIAAEIVVTILPLPEDCVTLLAIYDSLDKAARSVSQIMAARIVPAALELMDRPIIQAVEDSYKSGFPREAEAVLIIEIDGLKDSLAKQGELIRSICQDNGVVRIEQASSVIERERLWAGRKGAFGAIARLRPSYMVNDGTVPRTKLPEVLMKVGEISRRYSLLIGNVAHAGDGNLHPVILFDERDESEKQRVIQAGTEILRVCAEAGGTISGEHGIGLEKKREMGFIFSERDIKPMLWIKESFDMKGLCNPEKIFPREKAMPLVDAAKLENTISPEPGGKYLFDSVKSSCENEARTGGTEYEYLESMKRFSPSTLPCLERTLNWAHENRIPMEITGKFFHNRGLYPADQLQNTGSSHALSRLMKEKRGDMAGLQEKPLPNSEDLVSSNRIYISTANLNEVQHFDPENFYVSLQAGITCQRLEGILAEHNLMVPLDSPFPEIDSVGGCLAGNYRGLRSARYGIPRDWVLGLTMALPGHGSFRCGGRTVKNVSGYDLVRLMVGSHGTLGVIAEATLRLYPQHEASASVILELKTFEAAMEFGRMIRNNRLILPSSLQCYSLWGDTGEKSGGGMKSRFKLPRVFLILEGQRRDIQRQLTEIDRLTQDMRHIDPRIIAAARSWEEGGEKAIWDEWKRIIPNYLMIPAGEGYSFLFKVSCLPADLKKTITEIVGLNRNHDLESLVMADLPSGIAWLAVRCQLENGYKMKKQARSTGFVNCMTAFWEELQKLILPQKRFITVYSGTGHGVKKIDEPGLSSALPLSPPLFSWVFPEKLALMSRLKSHFDPHWILNSDRFPVK